MSQQAGFRYLRLADEMAERIAQGVYRPEERLPSIRHWRQETGWSVATIHQAFMELEKRGVVEARPRSGFYVRYSQARMLPAPVGAATTAEPCKVVFNSMLVQLLSRAEQDPTVVPLGGALLAPSYFPSKTVSRLLKSLSPERMERLSQYGHLAGHPDLRRHLAQRPLGEGRAAHVDEIVITSGCMEAVHLALRAVTRPGDAVAVESPTFFGFLQMFEDLGLYAVEVPTDPQTGVDPEKLEGILADERIKACLFIPNHHNPLGTRMPLEHKRRIAALAARKGVPIIEDDLYGDLTLEERRPETLKCFDLEGLILYCSSFSKTLAPGLRVGWILPGRFLDRVLRLRAGSVISSPPLMQHLTARLLEEGVYDRHLRRLRGALGTNLHRLSQAVARYFPAGTRITHPRGGFLLWVEMPPGVDGLALHEQALEAGVSILPGTLCSPSRRYRHCIRLSGGHPWSDRMDEAVARLGGMAHQMVRTSGGGASGAGIGV